MTDAPFVHLIAGVSSAGKSTLIARMRKRQRPGLMGDVCFAYEIQPGWQRRMRRHTFIHYNLLRPADLGTGDAPDPLQSDPVFRRLTRCQIPMRITILVADRPTLERRIARRQAIEPALRGDTTEYPARKILTQLQSVSQAALVAELSTAFSHTDAPIDYVQSTDEGFLKTDLRAAQQLEWWG
ncbi:hypothetical protein KDD17_06970 [Sulfitobacter albidus]|uniref:Uncharacterized protein n=1 Tax=Sulfitobacter albidus TaxID=2829501 RepID=A0A975JFV3_9RHOB|nr:hypothetical protein [Sulfitobacter albidus]QUJ77693.1 hypothetical protein KDD17_06970 [Sulfitobacter albidus]